MHMAKSLKAKIILYFHTTKKTSKKYVLVCILALITSLLKSREFGQYFKNSKKKLFCFVLVSGIMNLYVKRIPNIKKSISFNDIEQLGFYPIIKGSPYRGLFFNCRQTDN